MKTEIIKDLVKVANSLDQKGLYKESDIIDSLILKLASDQPRLRGIMPGSIAAGGQHDPRRLINLSKSEIKIYNLEWQVEYLEEGQGSVFFNLKVDGEEIPNEKREDKKWRLGLITFSWSEFVIRDLNYVIRGIISDNLYNGKEVRITNDQVEEGINDTELNDLKEDIEESEREQNAALNDMY